VILLQPVAQLYGQVRMDRNHRIVIDCSLSHPAGHKPFTRSHCFRMYHVTYRTSYALCWMRFSVLLSACVFTTPRSFACALSCFSLIRGAPLACPLSEKSIDLFARYECISSVVKTSRRWCQESVNVCRCALLSVTQNSRVTSPSLPASSLEPEQAFALS